MDCKLDICSIINSDNYAIEGSNINGLQYEYGLQRTVFNERSSTENRKAGSSNLLSFLAGSTVDL
jgi:hypothetical protein